MAPQVGLNVALVNKWLNTLRNEPFTVPITCAQLHVGIPGAHGTEHASVITQRQAFTFLAADSGIVQVTGTPPLWNIGAPELLSHISVWSGFDGDDEAMFLFSAVMLPPRQVADGDKFNLGSVTLAFPAPVLAAS